MTTCLHGAAEDLSVQMNESLLPMPWDNSDVIAHLQNPKRVLKALAWSKRAVLKHEIFGEDGPVCLRSKSEQIVTEFLHINLGLHNGDLWRKQALELV